MEMAYSTCDFAPKSQIEAVQTVSPFKVTDPRPTCQVKGMSPTATGFSGIFQGCLNIVLYYKKTVGEESGSVLAGWIRESLARALLEQPMLSGRLRRGGEEGNGDYQIVANDSGVRLVESKIGVTIQEFLDSKEREKSEAELVFWKQIDEETPQFSPLFYVQVTNFECGGYSVGITCSLLLADHLITGNFLQRWAAIHQDIISNTDGIIKPIFFLPSLKSNCLFPSLTFTSTPNKKRSQTLTVKIGSNASVDYLNSAVDTESCKQLSCVCIDEAENKLGSQMSSGFHFLVKESAELLQVQSCQKNGFLGSKKLNLERLAIINCSSLGDLGMNEIAFQKGNHPACASCWIGSIVDGFVMAIPGPKEDETSEVNVIVTIPS